jgi:PAS domain S-box-containing protein
MAQFQFQTQAVGGSAAAKPVASPAVLLVTADLREQARLGCAAPPAYALLTAGNLNEALTLWRTSIITWVLLDLTWPDGGGLDFLATLAAGSQQRPLPVTVLVDSGQERMALEAMKRGATDYQFKSELTPEHLWASLPLETLSPAQPPSPPLNALEQARQHYQNLVENSPDIVERFDCQLRHLYVSPRLSHLTGLETEAFLGKTCRELGMDEAMVNDWERAATALLATGERQTIEFSTPTLMGRRHFEMAIAPEWSELGQIESILCISRDISDRIIAQQAQAQWVAQAQAAQAEARTARDLLTGVLERINDGIAAFDVDDRLIYVNHRAAQLLGRQASELLGKTLPTAFTPAPDQEPNPEFHRAYQQAKSQQQPVYEEHFYPGFNRWFEHRIYPDASGITVYFTDITDRKTATTSRLQAEQMRHELALLERMLDSVLGGYWDLDFEHNTAYYSPGLKAMLGYSEAEVPNSITSWQQICCPEDILVAQSSFERHVESRGEVPHYVEIRFRHRDGSTVWVICAGQVIAWDTLGQPLRAVGCHVDITRLKQTEAKLKTSEAHLRLAQRIGNQGSWELELATEQVTWSDQVYRIFGLPLRERPENFGALQNFIHPDDQDRHRQTIEVAVAHCQPFDAEFCIVCLDGSLSHIQAKGEPMVDASGQVTHLIGTVLDIGERKRSEDQRQQAEAQLQKLSLRLRLALESANIGTWERIVSTNEVIWDPCLVDLYGFGDLDHSATYQEWQAKVYADDLDRVEAGHQALLDHDIPYDIEFRIWRGDGSLGWIRSSALVQRDAQGQALSVIGINYDITEQKRAAVELQHLSERLSLALESGGFGSWEVDLGSDIINWDQQLKNLYGLAHLRRPITYSDWRSRVHQDDLPTVEAAMRAALETNAPYDIAFRIWRGGGELRWIQSNGLVRRNAQGQPTSVIGINYDITDRKRTEQQILHTTAQLETSNRELEAFAYSVSHDLRAPLRAIDGFSRALVEDFGDQFGEEGRDYFDRIRHNVGRMGQLIDDLLRLSRVSRSTMVYTPVDLSALVQEQIDELAAADPERTVTVAITPDITVSADPTLIRVAIANLVQNAWKFTAHHATATLEFGVMTEQGEPIYYLRDDGAGFDMTYTNKLFGVFQRLHNTDEFPGTGIGLATVQRAIHRHGGRVWAEAAVEQGATFYFTLPVLPALEVQP